MRVCLHIQLFIKLVQGWQLIHEALLVYYLSLHNFDNFLYLFYCLLKCFFVVLWLAYRQICFVIWMDNRVFKGLVGVTRSKALVLGSRSLLLISKLLPGLAHGHEQLLAQGNQLQLVQFEQDNEALSCCWKFLYTLLVFAFEILANHWILECLRSILIGDLVVAAS